MEITSIFSFLVHPGKNEAKQPEIGGVALPLHGNLFSMISSVFNKAIEECKIDIAFSSTDGKQENERRNEIIALLNDQNLEKAHVIAERLQIVTTRRSGLGLFFIVLGSDGIKQQVYLSRFPADIGIIAHENEDSLHIELIERVFMKNASSYKAAVYNGSSFDADFWAGRAIDKQINDNKVAISSYWIREFLLSDFKTTSATGTRRLALAIKHTMDHTDDIEIKEELAAATLLAKSLDGQLLSMENFAERFALSEKTRRAIATTLSDPSLQFTEFIFSAEEFFKHIRYRSVSIDNGAILTAPVGKFDDCFERTIIDEMSNEYCFRTQGKIIDERLRNTGT